jgi:hypothetical protein
MCSDFAKDNAWCSELNLHTFDWEITSDRTFQCDKKWHSSNSVSVSSQSISDFPVERSPIWCNKIRYIENELQSEEFVPIRDMLRRNKDDHCQVHPNNMNRSNHLVQNGNNHEAKIECRSARFRTNVRKDSLSQIRSDNIEDLKCRATIGNSMFSRNSKLLALKIGCDNVFIASHFEPD